MSGFQFSLPGSALGASTHLFGGFIQVAVVTSEDWRLRTDCHADLIAPRNQSKVFKRRPQMYCVDGAVCLSHLVSLRNGRCVRAL